VEINPGTAGTTLAGDHEFGVSVTPRGDWDGVADLAVGHTVVAPVAHIVVRYMCCS